VTSPNGADQCRPHGSASPTAGSSPRSARDSIAHNCARTRRCRPQAGGGWKCRPAHIAVDARKHTHMHTHTRTHTHTHARTCTHTHARTHTHTHTHMDDIIHQQRWAHIRSPRRCSPSRGRRCSDARSLT
jgi:hypothetical protein